MSAEQLTSPDTEVGHGRNFSAVRWGLKYAKAGFPLLVFSPEQTGLNLWIPTEDYADRCPPPPTHADIHLLSLMHHIWAYGHSSFPPLSWG